MRAAATVRWAWHVHAAAEVEADVRNEFDVNGVAFGIAARIVGGFLARG